MVDRRRSERRDRKVVRVQISPRAFLLDFTFIYYLLF